MTTTRRTQAAALLLTALMVGSVFAGGAVGAAPTIDTATSTDTTTTQSDLQDGTVVGNVSGTDDNDTYALEVNVTDGDYEPAFNISANGTDHTAFKNTSMNNHTTNANAGAHWNGTVTTDELDDLERSLNENVTTTLTAWNTSQENETTQAVVYWNFTDDRSVEVVSDGDVDDSPDDLSVSTVDEARSLTNPFGADQSTIDAEDRNVSGDDSVVVLALPNSTVNDDFDVASDASDEETLWAIPMSVTDGDGTKRLIKVYNEEPPDGVDEDDDTYGVYKDSGIGGTDGIEVHLGANNFEDADEVSVRALGGVGTYTQFEHRAAVFAQDLPGIGALAGFLTGSPFGGLVSSMLIVGAPTARRRRRAA